LGENESRCTQSSWSIVEGAVDNVDGVEERLVRFTNCDDSGENHPLFLRSKKGEAVGDEGGRDLRAVLSWDPYMVIEAKRPNREVCLMLDDQETTFKTYQSHDREAGKFRSKFCIWETFFKTKGIINLAHASE
jgi:hypothetical protein